MGVYAAAISEYESAVKNRTLRGLSSFGSLLTTCAAVAAVGACGGSSEDANPGAAAGSGGQATGDAGTGGEGNSGGTAGDAAGGDGGGGEANPGGAGGSAGSGGDNTPSCAPPENPNAAALCLSINAETMVPVAGDENLDGEGVLIVEIFDRPDVHNNSGPDVEPLLRYILPEPTGLNQFTTMPVGDIPEMVRFEDLPETVYLFSIFADNMDVFGANGLTWGTWVGGIDLSNGLRGGDLQTVQLKTGEGTSSTLDLTALRRLRVTIGVDNGITLPDDGQGPVYFDTFKLSKLDQNTPSFGSGQLACGDLSDGKTEAVEGIVITGGTHWLVGQLDEYNQGSFPDNGAVHNIKIDQVTATASVADSVTFAADQYAAAVSITLGEVGGNDGSLPSYSCP